MAQETYPKIERGSRWTGKNPQSYDGCRIVEVLLDDGRYVCVHTVVTQFNRSNRRLPNTEIRKVDFLRKFKEIPQ